MNMHFLFFIVNLLSWTVLGIIIGKIILQNHRRKENKTLFLATLSALLGGSTSFATHGMWTDLGIDFFNLFFALGTSIATVYAFVPERREAVSLLFAKASELVKSTYIKTQGVPQAQLGQNFWNGIRSTLVPR